MSVSTARILLMAADIIEAGGLAKGAYFKAPGFNMEKEVWRDPLDIAQDFKLAGDTPKCCALGAIYMAGAVVRAESPEVVSAMDRLAKTLDIPNAFAIPDWNDAPSRRKQQVVAALRRAADWSKW